MSRSPFNTGRRLVIGVPFLWLFLFFLLPFAIVLKISFAEADVAIPPYTEIFRYAEQQLQVLINLGNYIFLTEDELYLSAYLGSLKIAFISTLLCLLLGYPMAYAIARSSKEAQTVFLLLIMMPTWTAILIRVYAWMGILSNNGLLNGFLQGIGLIDQPLQILNTNLAVYIGIVYSYLPFMILPIYSVMKNISPSYMRAAVSLGCHPFASFWRVYFPQTLAGVGAGSLLVFIIAIGYYITPALLGSPNDQMVSYFVAFYTNTTINWGMATALGGLLLLATMLLYVVYSWLVGASRLRLG